MHKDMLIKKLSSMHTLIFDFDGVFTNNKVYVNQNGLESVCCDRRDGLAIDLLRHLQSRQAIQLDTFILSTEKNPIVAARAKKMQLTFHQSIENKLAFLKQYFSNTPPRQQSGFDGLIYLGNDLNDLPVMRRAKFAVAPADAHPLVKSIAHLVLKKKGGDGFVREFIEYLLTTLTFDIGEHSELIFNS